MSIASIVLVSQEKNRGSGITVVLTPQCGAGRGSAYNTHRTRIPRSFLNVSLCQLNTKNMFGRCDLVFIGHYWFR